MVFFRRLLSQRGRPAASTILVRRRQVRRPASPAQRFLAADFNILSSCLGRITRLISAFRLTKHDGFLLNAGRPGNRPMPAGVDPCSLRRDANRQCATPTISGATFAPAPAGGAAAADPRALAPDPRRILPTATERPPPALPEDTMRASRPVDVNRRILGVAMAYGAADWRSIATGPAIECVDRATFAGPAGAERVSRIVPLRGSGQRDGRDEAPARPRRFAPAP
jgi:hypothetical protein